MMLLDASGLLNLILGKGEESVDVLRNNYITDLTFYEIGNAIWKSVRREFFTQNEAEELLRTFGKIAGILNVAALEKGKLNEVFEISVKETITFYDASYIFIAAENGLGLVTDDKKLKKAADKYLEVVGSDRI